MRITSRRLKWLAATVASLGALSVLAACGGGGSPAAGPGAPADTSGLTTVTVADTLGSYNVQMAIDKGFFKKYGLNVKLSYLNNGTSVLAALEGGSVDIGYADLYAGINAVSNGFNVQLVANNNGDAPTMPLEVTAGSDIKSVADLAGKKIGTSPVPQFTVNLRGLLQANGINPYSVSIVYVQALTALPQALTGGTVNAILASGWTSVYQYNFAVVGKGDTSSWADPQATTAGFWSTDSWATANTRAEDEFDNALHAFDEWWKALSPQQAAAFDQKYYGVNFTQLADGSAAKLENLVNSDSAETGPVNLSATQAWYELGLRYAPDKIAKGVDWKAHVFSSALQPAPSS